MSTARQTGMKRLRGLPLAGVLSLLVLTTACAQAASPGSGGTESPGPMVPTAFTDDDVVLRVEYVGGFMLPEALVTRVPTVTVYGDGRVITDGPVIAIYPGPALPNLQVQRISREDVVRLAERAVAAGVGRTTDFGQPMVADAPSTRITVLTVTGHKHAEANALDFESTPELTEDQQAARAKLRELIAALTDLPATLGADAVGPAEPYRPAALAAVASPWTEPDDDALPAPPELAWIGPPLPGEENVKVHGVHCVTVTGSDAAELFARAMEATVLTPWVSGGERWRVAFRPLLPDESGCSDLRPY